MSAYRIHSVKEARGIAKDGGLHPRPFKQIPINNITLEFLCSAGSSTTYTITRGMVRRALISETGATTGFCLFNDVKLDRVAIWSLGNPNNAAIQSTTIALEYLGTGAPGRVIRDTGNPFSPAHVSVTPPADSYAELWGSTGNDADNLFTMTINPGDLVRLYVRYTLTNGAMTAVTSSGTGTNGVLAFNALAAITLLSTATNASTVLWS